MTERCETCRFYRAMPAGDTVVCARMPPVWAVFSDEKGRPMHSTEYPAPSATWWCGEWQAKAQEPAKPKEREPGWYWVRMKPDGFWTIANWGGTAWTLHAFGYIGESEIAEIDERRIERQPPDHCLGPKL